MPTRRELLRDLVREDARVIAEQKEKKIRKNGAVLGLISSCLCPKPILTNDRFGLPAETKLLRKENSVVFFWISDLRWEWSISRAFWVALSESPKTNRSPVASANSLIAA
jgi:hypothetical protein